MSDQKDTQQEMSEEQQKLVRQALVELGATPTVVDAMTETQLFIAFAYAEMGHDLSRIFVEPQEYCYLDETF